MKNVTTDLQKSLKKRANRTVVAWTVTRTDGVKYAFTSGDQPFVYDGMTFEPTNGFSQTAAASKNNLSVDNISALAMLTPQITEKEIKNGKLDNAFVRIFWIDPFHPEYGIVPLRGGRVGEVKIVNQQFETEMRAVSQALQQPFGRVYTLECTYTLGDSLCGVNLTPAAWSAALAVGAVQARDAKVGTVIKPTVYNGMWFKAQNAGTTGAVEPVWPTTAGATVADNGITWLAFMAREQFGTVTSGAGRVTFYDLNCAAPDSFFQYGYVEFLTGDNAGFKTEIREYVHSPRPGFRLLEQTPFRIKIGDTYRAVQGCAHTRLACTQFDNMFNYGGFPDMPTEDKALATPNTKQGTAHQDDGGKG